MKPIQNIFFDLDNTLLDWVGASRVVIPELFRDRVEDDPEAAKRFLELYTEHFEVLEQGHAQGELDWQKDIRFERFRFPLKKMGYEPDLADELETQYIQQVQQRLEPFPNSGDTLARLKQLDVNLAVITDGPTGHQRSKLQRAGMDHFFDRVFLTVELNSQKPDPYVFEYALERMGWNRENSAHIGDSLIKDVAGARQVGLQAIWFNPRNKSLYEHAPTPDVIIDDLSQLPSFIQKDEKEGRS